MSAMLCQPVLLLIKVSNLVKVNQVTIFVNCCYICFWLTNVLCRFVCFISVFVPECTALQWVTQWRPLNNIIVFFCYQTVWVPDCKKKEKKKKLNQVAPLGATKYVVFALIEDIHSSWYWQITHGDVPFLRVFKKYTELNYSCLPLST